MFTLVDLQGWFNGSTPLLSPLVSTGILVIAYLNWRVRTVKLRFCKTCQLRDASVNPEGTVTMMVSLENYGDEGCRILQISRLCFSTDTQILPEPEVLELDAECYGKQSLNVYSIPLRPDGHTTYIIAVKVTYKSLEGLGGGSRLPFGVKNKLFLLECHPGCLPQSYSSPKSDKPYLHEIIEVEKRQVLIKALPKRMQ